MGLSRETVLRALAEHGGRVAEAALDLGIHRNQLYRLIKGFGIERPEHGEHPEQAEQSGPSHNPHVRSRNNEGRRTFPTVSATVEMPGRKLTHRTIAVSPEHFEMLREAKWDLQASLRKDFSEATVLGLFIAEAFEGWLQGRKEDK